MKRTILPSLVLLAASCGNEPPAVAPANPPIVTPTSTPPVASAIAEPVAAAPMLPTNVVPRTDFNRLAMALAHPLFWASDKNQNGTLDPNELEVFWGLEASVNRSDYARADTFTERFYREYEAIAKAHQAEQQPAPSATSEDKRRALVRSDLAQGRQTLVLTDLSGASAEQKAFARRMLTVAELIERLFSREMGAHGLRVKGDPESRALFFRNQGPRCSGPLTQNDPNCYTSEATPNLRLSGLYPLGLMVKNSGACTVRPEGDVRCASGPVEPDAKFCDSIDRKLMDPFVVVGGEKGNPKAVPYTDIWKDDMQAVSRELAKAADELTDPNEGALRAYLRAASKSFTDNQWWPADEAWAKMGATNSKFYLRVAPDEVYAEPCSTKSLFHVSFGLINKGSLVWQEKLDPQKTAMEQELAKLAGPPYKARNVSFKLPDFIDMALNAGDSRHPSGATIGQSLPNFGPVANEGRGRTVVMTNLYTDPDSLAATVDVAKSLFCADTMSVFTTEPEPQLVSTVLHEAAHNLGPAHQYAVNGKTDREVFGGPLAATLEELKAQTAAEFFTEWLVGKKELDRAFADQSHVRNLYWAFGHISRGMYDEDQHPKNYSQLAAIQLGHLMKEKAVVFRANEVAANGKDKGCYAANLKKTPAAFLKLMKIVAGIKGRGDKKLAETLIRDYVDATGEPKTHHERIRKRVLRAPKASFVYAVRFE